MKTKPVVAAMNLRIGEEIDVVDAEYGNEVYTLRVIGYDGQGNCILREMR